MKLSYYVIILVTIAWGILTLALQNYNNAIWIKCKRKISVFLSIIGALVFMASLQSYAELFVFMFLIIKGIMLIKR